MSDLAKLTFPEVAARLERGCAAILPVGSTEAHGPHLPLDTDVTIALGMARRAALRLEQAGRACVVLPPVSYSVTDFAAPFAGTLGLPAELAAAHLAGVLGAALARGFAPVALANAHLEPAHIASIRAALESVRQATGTEVAFPDVTRRPLAARLGDEFVSGACHAGRYETSLVMADDPGSVREELRQQLSPNEHSLVDAIRAGQGDFVAAGGPLAYFGHPAQASATEGDERFGTLADMLVEALHGAGDAK